MINEKNFNYEIKLNFYKRKFEGFYFRKKQGEIS